MNRRERQLLAKRLKYHANPAYREKVLAGKREYARNHKRKGDTAKDKLSKKAWGMLRIWFPGHLAIYQQMRRQQKMIRAVGPGPRPIMAVEYIHANGLKVTDEMRWQAWGLDVGHRKLVGGKVRHVYERQLAPVLDRICLACPKSDCTAENSYMDCDVVMASSEVQKLDKVVTIDARRAYGIAWRKKFQAIDCAQQRMKYMRRIGYEFKGTKESFGELLAYLASRIPLFDVGERKEGRAALDRMRNNYRRERLSYYKERKKQVRDLVVMIPRFRRTELYRLSPVMLKMICLREIHARIITPEEFVAREKLVSPIADYAAWKARHHWNRLAKPATENAFLGKERSFAVAGSGK